MGSAAQFVLSSITITRSLNCHDRQAQVSQKSELGRQCKQPLPRVRFHRRLFRQSPFRGGIAARWCTRPAHFAVFLLSLFYFAVSSSLFVTVHRSLLLATQQSGCVAKPNVSPPGCATCCLRPANQIHFLPYANAIYRMSPELSSADKADGNAH